MMYFIQEELLNGSTSSEIQNWR